MLLFFVISIALLALAGGLFWRWRQRIQGEIVEGAAIEWAHLQKHEPEFVAHLNEASFGAIYSRVNTPRFPGYVLAVAATFLLSLPVTFGAITGSIWAAGKLGLLPAPVEIVDYVRIGPQTATQPWQCDNICKLYIAEAFSGFFVYFAVLIIWLSIVAVFSRRYHGRRPGYLRDEIIRAKP